MGTSFSRRTMFTSLAVTALLIGSWCTAAQAEVAYSDNFSGGAVDFTTSDSSYWLSCPPSGHSGFGSPPYQDTGCVVSSSNQVYDFGPSTTYPNVTPPTGDSYLLVEGTKDNPTVTGFFISPSFTVSANTLYDISFLLTNIDNGNVAQIQPEINGTLLGPAVSANGVYNDGNPGDNWQLFQFTWYSGSSTTATLTLNDNQPSGNGNDFAIDNISVATPEPGTLTLFASALAALAAISRRRSKP